MGLHIYYNVHYNMYWDESSSGTQLQSGILTNKIFFPEKQGFFIEAGAAGGELFSNTLYFEINHNWTGLLVEPNPDWWDELKGKNRWISERN